ncbi:hypothetical protein Taro_010412 [Colocasia esculenta]|uniref:Glucan endo-1,3-beta-D-glucosidase n=1 Tax=Colocasia esculenta TaxID=4460 RepID=A0A843U6W8_COLES|nr:hypothetical protein [Colocasia esculenta]
MVGSKKLSVVAATLLLLLGIMIASPTSPQPAVGVCYGWLGNNMPSHTEVVSLYKSLNINKMRLYSPNQQTLRALRGTNIELLLDAPGPLQTLAENATAASDWVRTNVLAHWPAVRFRYIAVGNNEVIVQKGQAEYVLPAMRNIYGAIVAAGLKDHIKVSTSVQYSVVGVSYPPSAGEFSLPVMKSIAEFLASTGAPLLVNLYPYFTYASDPNVGLAYALFTASEAVMEDPNSGVKYQNLFDAMVDTVSAALEKTGWPTAAGLEANPENARIYNTNLMRHVGRGTPRNPGKAVETYIFSIFNENQKQPPGIENNFGLFYPSKQPVYPITFGSSAASRWTIHIVNSSPVECYSSGVDER